MANSILFPALFTFVIPTALGWDYLSQLDTSRLRLSFLLNIFITIVIVLTLFDNAIFVLQRNPLAVAVGAQSRQRYIERVNPSYASLMQIMDGLPTDASIYSLFEPRSYGLPRQTQPDLVLFNFSHDLYLYKTPSAILEHWKAKGYTHILLYERGLDILTNSPGQPDHSFGSGYPTWRLWRVSNSVAQTPDKIYSIYRLP